jgi:small-conductance mechanosensitive channel
MKRIIFLGLFISTLAVLGAVLLYFIPNPQNLAWFKKGLEILLLSFSTWVLLRLLNRFIWPGIRENFKIKISHIFVLMLNIFIVMGSLLGITIGILGLDTKTILTSSGLVTAGLTIALQGIVGDIAASLIIDLDRLYKIGDWIKVGEAEGKVTNIGWRHTELLTLQNTRMILNNGTMLKTPVQNFSRNSPWALDEFTISINHDIPSHRVRRIVETSLQRHNGSENYCAQVLARMVEASGVTYFVRYGLEHQEDRWLVRHRVIDALRHELHAYGLRISESLGEYGLFRGNRPLIEKEISDQQEHLVQSELFQGFSSQHLKKIIALSQPFLVAENTIILHKGDLEKSLYIIGEGTVEVQLIDRETRLLHSGNYFGEQGFLLGNPRNATVVAKTNVLLYKYSKADLEPFFRLQPQALNQMLQLMINRSNELEEAIIQSKRTSKNESLEEIILKTVKEFFSE